MENYELKKNCCQNNSCEDMTEAPINEIIPYTIVEWSNMKNTQIEDLKKIWWGK